MSELKEKTISALIWNGIDKFGTNIIYLILGIVLARILSPGDYGMMGIITVFLNVANVIQDGGLGGALIRKQNADEKDYNSIFYFNLAVCLLLCLIFYFFAPCIGRFYENEELTMLLRVAFLSVVFNAMGLIHFTIFNKQIDFRATTLGNVVSLFVSGLIAVSAALTGWGVWSLVFQSLSFALIRTIWFWIISSWRPRWLFSFASIREMLGFGVSLLGTSLLNISFLQSLPIVIGKLFSFSSLGYYTQASKWSDMFINTLGGIFQSATYPVFSSISHEKSRLLNMYRKTMRLTAFVTFPLLTLLALLAEPLILGVLTDKWLFSVPYLQVLSVAGIFTVLSVLNQNFIKVEGDSRLLFRLELFKIILMALAIASSYQLGVYAMVVAFGIARVVVYLVAAVIIGKRVNYNILYQFKDMFPYIALTLLSLAVVLPLKSLVTDTWLSIFAIGSLFCSLYFGLAWILGSKIFGEMLSFFKRT